MKAQLEGGRQAKAAQTTKGPERKGQQAQGSKTSKEAGSENEQEEVVLTLTDRTGQSWPVPEQTGLESNDKGRKRKKKKQIVSLTQNLKWKRSSPGADPGLSGRMVQNLGANYQTEISQ